MPTQRYLFLQRAPIDQQPPSPARMQEMFAISHELPDDDAILREHEGGWQGCLESLARFLET